MEIAIGLFVILIAGIFQGTFVTPLSMTKKWNWENGWFTFSLLGMIILNWVLALIFIPNLSSVYSSCSLTDLSILALFGLGWGCGSVLFGIGMDRLGLSLGYPIIMGLIASLGAIIPLAILSPAGFISLKGGVLLLSAAIVLAGIVICSKANSIKQKGSNKVEVKKSSGGLMIAVAAGVLSCLPNVGASFGSSLTEAAKEMGTSASMAGNAVWALFYTVGFIPNAAYTIYLLSRNKTFSNFKQNTMKNGFWCFLMSIMWIGSFYLYGTGASKMGNWGLILGWPLFISLSIVVGNLWGYWRGEWKGADLKAKKMLNYGMLIIIVAMILLGICNFF